MPIANCGFAPTVDSNIVPPRLVAGTQALTFLGPTLQVEVGFDPDLYGLQQTQQSQGAPKADPLVVPALIDTGARESAVDEDIAKQLGLPLVDVVDGSGIGGTEKFNIYLGHIRIAALGYLQYGRFMGVKLRSGGQPHLALLGRTVLESMVLVYDGRDGSVRLAV